MIPATGFLAQVNNTNQLPDPSRLPEPHSFTYGDGSQESYQELEDDAPDLEVLTVNVGSISVTKSYGFDNTGRFGFKLGFHRHDTYGFVMLDYIGPIQMTQFIQLAGA